MAQNRKSNRGKRRQRTFPNVDIDLVAAEVPDEKDTSARLMDAWSGSRSGGWASRGFDFQHTVAAWLAARMIAGDLQAHALVPEGLEDISIESGTSRHVQVKSRGERLGAFPVGIASNHIVDSWFRHRQRSISSDSLTVVFERGITGETGLTAFDTSLDESLDRDSTLREMIATAAKKRGLDDSDVQELLDQTSVYTATWTSIDESSRSLLGRIFESVSPAVLDYLARELRGVVADTARLNAEAVKYTDRNMLDRSELTQRSHHFIEQLDVSALETAITLGLCSPLSLTDELNDDCFYEGVATQPGHVAAGLVVPRTDLIGEAVIGVQETSSVILTGPSGVGKSAVLWSVPQALPGVLWFRVNRLSEADVAEVLRLCRSHRVSDANPIGLLVDAAGSGQFRGWPQLREEVAATPGLFIISTARHEDLLILGDVSGCRTITVALDEDAAEAIFNGLRDRNATDSPHWREAFEQAEGLTLEFTHLLTRGERLSSVIREQVRRRISERRYIELDLLSLCATADRWSAALPVENAAKACGVSQLELREPLARLAEEHLLVERNGTISGVHQLRSVAISRAIHDRPPPILDHTISRLLPALAPEQVRRLIPNALRDEPQLDQLIHDAALNERNDIVKLTAYLRGFRLFDFYEQAVKWTEIAQRCGIPPAEQPLAQLFAINDALLPDAFSEDFKQAVLDMAAAPERSRGLALIVDIGAQRLAEVLATATDLDIANGLLFELQGSNTDIATECQSALSPSSPLIEMIRRAPVAQAAKLLATVNSLSPNLAHTLIEMCGGESAMEARIKGSEPWIVDIRIDDSGSEAIARARVLHVSDAVHGDPHDRVIALGRLLLRCFPRTAHVDVKTVLPGGHEYRIGEHQVGSTNLRREYEHSELEVAWNRERMHVTNAVLGATDTERLAAALPLLESAAQVLRVFGNAFTAAETRFIDVDQLANEIHALEKRAKQIPPRLNGPPSVLGVQPQVDHDSLAEDPLSGLVTDLTSNVFPRLTKFDAPAAVAAHLSDKVIAKSLRRAQREPWHLLGYATFPESLETLETDLNHLLAVVAAVAEDATSTQVLRRAARAGQHKGALSRAAESARSRTRRIRLGRKTDLEQVGRHVGWRLRVYAPKEDRYQLVPEWLITFDISSLLDWGKALEEIGFALQTSKRPREKFVLVPVRNGKPVESLTFSLISSFIPTGELGRWRSDVAPAHETPLTDALDSAIQALQIRSGVLALPESQRGNSSVVSVVEEAKQDFARSRRSIMQTPDAITEQIHLFLTALEDLVASEADGESLGGALAGQLWGLTTQGQQTKMTDTLYSVRLAALEWDIDRKSALGDPTPSNSGD